MVSAGCSRIQLHVRRNCAIVLETGGHALRVAIGAHVLFEVSLADRFLPAQLVPEEKVQELTFMPGSEHLSQTGYTVQEVLKGARSLGKLPAWG